MSDGYTIENVTQDLNSLLMLTKIFEADSRGFWQTIDRKERFLYEIDKNDPTTSKEIVNFQDPMPRGDYYYFNPLSEGFGKKTPTSAFFYRLIRIALNLNIRTALLYSAGECLAHKRGTETEKEHKLSHVVMRINSVPLDRKSTLYDVIDEKMLVEFKDLFDRMKDECVYVAYKTSDMTAKVTCEALTGEGFDEKYGKDIRKKSLSAFKALLMGIFGISKPDQISQFEVKYDPTTKSAASLHTRLQVYLNLYSRFNDVLADAYGTDGVPSERNQIDLGTLSEVIERLPMAYAIAKHMGQSSLPKGRLTDTKAADTTTLRIGDTDSKSRFGRFKGPESIGEPRGLSIGGPALNLGGTSSSANRFRPRPLDDRPADPFSPYVKPSTSFSNQGGLNLGGSSGYFNNGFQGGGGLNLNATPPSNFGNNFSRGRY